MASSEQHERDREAFHARADRMFEETYAWRQAHPHASLDEIVDQAIPHRRKLMGLLLQQLASQNGTGEVLDGLQCERCGRPMVYKGRLKREVEHLEAGIELKRAYYYCPQCQDSFFPPRPATTTE